MDITNLTLHPFTVHLPIGVILAASGFAFVGWYRRHQAFEQCGYYLVVLGWFATIPSLVSGTIDAVNRLNDPHAPADTLWWINVHAFSAICLFVVMWLAWQRRRRISGDVFASPQFARYLWLLVVAVCVVLLSGWTGGHMVYSLHLGRMP